MSGMCGLSCARAAVTAWSTKGRDSSGSTSRKRSTSASARMGLCSTGPSPALNSNCMPIGSRISKISAKMIAASTPRRSTAVTVTSAARSGVLQSSRKDTLARIWRYSGIYCPAWRISHTGVYGVDSWRQARSRGESYSSGLSWPEGSTCAERCDDSDTPVAFHEGNNDGLCGIRALLTDAATVQEPAYTVKIRLSRGLPARAQDYPEWMWPRTLVKSSLGEPVRADFLPPAKGEGAAEALAAQCVPNTRDHRAASIAVSFSSGNDPPCMALPYQRQGNAPARQSVR